MRKLMFTFVAALMALATTQAQTESSTSDKLDKKPAVIHQVKTKNQQEVQTGQAVPQRPKMSKADSLKRQHKMDSIRKVMADRRAKDGPPKVSREDSLKRVHRMDSLRKVAKERSRPTPQETTPNRREKPDDSDQK